MHPLTKITHEFEGEPLTSLTYAGRPAWIAREIGQRLGYAGRGKRLTTRIRREWADEFIEGTDYVLLKGDDLTAFKAMLEPGTQEVPSRTAGLMLLLEPGIHLVLTKTDKPVGKRLRRFLVDEVLPQLLRSGAYAPEPEKLESVLVAVTLPALPAPVEGFAERREGRLARQAEIRERWIDLQDRRLRVDALQRLGARLGDDDARMALQVAAAEIATGADLSQYRPEVERWTSPAEMAARWGLSVQRLGRVITRLGLRGDERYSKRVLSKARGLDRIVITYLYNEVAEALLAADLREAGLIHDGDDEG